MNKHTHARLVDNRSIQTEVNKHRSITVLDPCCCVRAAFVVIVQQHMAWYVREAEVVHCGEETARLSTCTAADVIVHHQVA